MSRAPQIPAPHRRYDPLAGRWVLVSAHRTQRPWLGGTEHVATEALPRRDPGCYLCPGSTRANGEVNPEYDTTFVFTNDFPALLEDSAPVAATTSPLFRAHGEPGTCRVICFSPRHDLTLPELEPAAIEGVVDLWADQVADLGAVYRWVQVFENKGEAMGASNPHPHGQIWAGSSLPTEVAAEDRSQADYLGEHGRPMLLDYVEAELDEAERVIHVDEEWVVVVPYWAVWPFETMLLPRRPVGRMPDLDEAQRAGLVAALRRLLVAYDNLFETSFPYSLGWHGAPFDDRSQRHWQFHGDAYPPLLRSATVRKFMVGYELLAEPQRDLTPEEAAARLRRLPGEHYLDRQGGDS